MFISTFTASLPTVSVGNTVKLERDVQKHLPTSPSIEKRILSTTQLDNASGPMRLDFKEALSFISEGLRLDSSVYVPLLQECIDKNSVFEAECIHGHIIKTGTYEDLFITTFLVNAYAKCGNMVTARKVFDKLPKRNVVTWTSLMTGYVQNSQPGNAIWVFQEMLEVGAYPTNFTLGVVLNACSLLYAIKLGRQIHGYIVKYGTEDDSSVGNALCSLYSKCGNLNSAIQAFWRIGERNLISWTTLISACGDNGDSAMGLSFFIEMLTEGNQPNEFTLTSILSICCVMEALKVGLQVHSSSIKLGYGSSLPVMNSVMYLYLKCGWISEAKKLFDGMEMIRLVTWNAMIAGHAQMMDLAEDGLSKHCSGIEALILFLRLNRSGMKPDLFTFSSILSVCSGLIALEQGEQVHAQTIKSGYLSDMIVSTALVNMYSKCGNIDRATKAFVEMSTRTLISWTSMITAFAQNGRPQQALQLFEDMRLAGVRPNKVTFVGVLSACSHAGMVDEALAYFEMMKNEYNIKPAMDHYACLIDMFTRSGRLDEAFNFVENMDVEPSQFIWSILIGGCRRYGNLEFGFYAAEKLLNLNPKDSETYIFLLNMYISTGRWKDVSRVKKIMRDKKIGKLKDCSWINIRNEVHSFKPDDPLHPSWEEVSRSLEDLLNKAKIHGYESHTGSEVTEEAEEDDDNNDDCENDGENPLSTIHHSERLAVAFGLLKTPTTAPIRVTKSISMCGDCHNFIKLVSGLAAREIIIRDSKRLHKFINGQCSCGNFASLL